MEKISSKSLFALSGFFTSTTSISPITSIINNTNNNNTTNEEDNENASDTENHNSNNNNNNKIAIERPKLYCNSCHVSFDDIKDHHQHYKGDWHRFVIISEFINFSNLNFYLFFF